jgi:hypothetical protein
MMRRPGQSTSAYQHILKALEKPAHGAHSAYVQLWPFIIGTLLRQVTATNPAVSYGVCCVVFAGNARLGRGSVSQCVRPVAVQGEAREQGEEDSDSWGVQVLLAQLLPGYDIDSNLCSPWMHRIYGLIVHCCC